MNLRRTPISRGSLILLIIAVAALILIVRALLFAIFDPLLAWVLGAVELGLVALLFFGKTQSGADLVDIERADQYIREQRRVARFTAGGLGLFFVGVLLVCPFGVRGVWSDPFYVLSLLAAVVLMLLPIALEFISRR